MILLITASKTAAECITAMEATLGEQVESVSTLQQATARLKIADFAAIVIDQSLMDLNPSASEALLKNGGAAIPVFANFAISSAERIVRDLRLALTRRQKEQLVAVRAAQAALRNELTGTVAGILLSSELALAHPGLPANIAEKLRSVYDLAMQLKSRLGNAA
jgi:CheY-like chemotaxis protein